MRIVDRRMSPETLSIIIEMFPKGTTDCPLDDWATLGLSDRIVAYIFYV